MDFLTNIKSEDINNEEQKTMNDLLSEIIKLKAENAELKSMIKTRNSLDQNYKSLTELIHEMREQNNKIIIEKDEEGRKLKKRMEEMELKKEMDDLKNQRNNVVYNQKMSVIHDIELENKIYHDEVIELKKKNKEMELITKSKIESLDILNQLKFTQFKKKMVDNLKEAKNNVSKLNLEYMDLNGKITILQNYQLLSEIEFQKGLYDNLEKENKKLKERVIDLEKELAIQKKVSIKLAVKSKKFKDKIKYESRNNKMNTNLSNENNSNNVLIKTIPEKNNNIIREYSNNSNYNTIYKQNSRKADFLFHLSLDKYNNKIPEINFKYIKYNKIIKEKDEEIEKLKILNDNLRNKLEHFNGTNKSLFLFLQECLNNYFNECKEHFLFKNININIADVKNFNFDNLKDEEKYGILVLLMKYLIPFIIASYEKINVKEQLFKTNINITQVKKDLQHNSPTKYLNNIFLKKSFGNKNILSTLFVDSATNQNYINKKIYINKKKKDSPNDSRIKNDKYKSLID